MWASILEKAWAKVKGNYINTNFGLLENGLHSLVGTPIFSQETMYILDEEIAQLAFEQLQAADAANYLMSVSTDGEVDSQQNSCGIAERHAYSILAVFTMIDKNGTEHKCLLMRNPWGLTGYNGTWSKDDPNWTDQLISDYVPW